MSKGTASTIVLVSGGILVSLALLSAKQGEDRYKAILPKGRAFPECFCDPEEGCRA